MAIYIAKYESGNTVQTLEIDADDIDNSKSNVVSLTKSTESGWVNVASFNREKLLLVYRDEFKK